MRSVRSRTGMEKGLITVLCNKSGMPFSFTPEDFSLCTAKRNDSEELWHRFIGLRNELTPMLEADPELERFVRYKPNGDGKTSSPYVPNYWKWSGAGYREGTWVGFADRRYREPRAGLQFEFVIRRERVDFEIWLEGVYNHGGFSTRQVEEKLYHTLESQRQKRILSRLRKLGSKYWIWAKRRRNLIVDENVTDLELDQIRDLLEGLESGSTSVALGISLSKTKVLKIQNVPEKILEMTRPLLPYYLWWSGSADGQGKPGKRPRGRQESRVTIGGMTQDDELEYEVRTRSKVTRARKKEAELVRRYAAWLGRQGRRLSIARYGSLSCDGYEAGRSNLIEAKSSIDREYIRMAAGQLLDYSYQGKKKLGESNMAILLPRKPDLGRLGWLSEYKIFLVWESRGKFVDNGRGQFV